MTNSAIKELGKRLAGLLDEDDWAYIEGFLQDADININQQKEYYESVFQDGAKQIRKHKETIVRMDTRVSELEACIIQCSVEAIAQAGQIEFLRREVIQLANERDAYKEEWNGGQLLIPRSHLENTIAGQAEQIKMLRKALTVAINYCADVGSEHWDLFDNVLTLTGGMYEPT